MLVFLTLVACTRAPDGLAPGAGHTEPVYGGTFVYAEDDDVRSLDPAVAYDEVSWTALHLVFDQLLAYDEEVRLVPSLADSWEVSDDGLVWTFHLRDDVTFHNGRAMVADDVTYSFDRLFDPALASPSTDFFRVIDGADDVLRGRATRLAGLSTPDAHTVAVRLARPDATFGNVVAMVFGSIVPREEVEARGERWAFEPVGTGPFVVTERSVGRRTTFTASTHYWEPHLPYLDAVVLKPNHPRDLQFLELEAGALHQVNRLTSATYLYVRSDPRWSAQLEEIPSADVYGELMNTELPPFDDVWFRRGVSSAVDRRKIEKVRNGRHTTTISWVPPGLPAHVTVGDLTDAERPRYRYQQHDPALARECLEKSRYYRDGVYIGPPITYLMVDNEANRVTSLALQSDLAALGVPISLKPTTFATYLSATGNRGEVQMAYAAWVMDYPDPRNFLEPWFHCDSRAERNSTNSTWYCNDAVDALLDAAAVEVDPVRRTALYREAQGRILEDAPVLVEYHSLSQSVAQPVVKGFRIHPIWPRDMRDAWLDLPDGRPSREAR